MDSTEMDAERYGNKRGGGTMGIIDFHTHGRWHQPFKYAAETLRLAKRMGIEKIVLLGGGLGFGHYPTEDNVRQVNDHTLKLVKLRPNEIIGLCYLNPSHSRRFIAGEIERRIEQEGFKGIKLSVAVNARSKRVDAIMRKAEELDAFILYHCWYKTVKKYRNESDPSDIAHLAARFPNVKIVMAHLTAAGIQGVQDIRPYPNIYPDTSGSQGFSGIVEYAVEQLGAERILFGSDIPGRDFSVQLGRIYGARITEKQKRIILSTNARKLLGIK